MRSIEVTIADLRFKNRQLVQEVEGYVRMVAGLRKRIVELEVKIPSLRSHTKDDVPVESILTKDPVRWGARDFLSYFQHLHLQWCGVPYRFSRAIYEASLAQLKGMRQRHGLSNSDIRVMFEFHFAKTFNDKFTPSVAYICGTSGMNRFYGATQRGKIVAAASPSSGYTRRQLEAKESWGKSPSNRADVTSLENRLRRRKM